MTTDFPSDTPLSFRDLPHSALLIQQLPLVRSVAKLRLLRLGYSLPEVAAALNLSHQLRRSPLTGSF